MVTVFIVLTILFIVTLICMIRNFIMQGLKSEMINGMVELKHVLYLLNRRRPLINAILLEHQTKSKLNLKSNRESYYLLRECIILTRDYTVEQKRYLLNFLKRYYKILLKYSSLDELKNEKR